LLWEPTNKFKKGKKKNPEDKKKNIFETKEKKKIYFNIIFWPSQKMKMCERCLEMGTL
jgi:hypothetical protein